MTHGGNLLIKNIGTNDGMQVRFLVRLSLFSTPHLPPTWREAENGMAKAKMTWMVLEMDLLVLNPLCGGTLVCNKLKRQTQPGSHAVQAEHMFPVTDTAVC